MNSTLKLACSVVLAMNLIGCSDSAQPDTINSLYRESDSYRAQLMAVGCEVGQQHTMSGKTAVTCDEEEDFDLLLKRAEILRDWAEVLHKIEQHPNLPGAALGSYKRLQDVVLEYADSVENFVVTSQQETSDRLAQITRDYQVWADAIVALEDELIELGCDFLAEPPPADFDSTCNALYGLQKIEIYTKLQELQEQGSSIPSRSAGTDFAEEADQMSVNLMDLIISLRNHMSSSAKEIQSQVSLAQIKFRSDYGLQFRFSAGAAVIEFIDLPEDKRSPEGVQELIAKLTEYVEAVRVLSEYRSFVSNASVLDTSMARAKAAEELLQEPLSLEYIIENYEPEKSEESEETPLLEDEAPQGPSQRPGGIFAGGLYPPRV